MLPGRRYTVDEVWYLVVRFKWLILLPWLVVSAATVLGTRLIPDQYRSESLIQVVAQRVPQNLVRSTITERIEDRLPAISQQILSRTRLERIIQDFGLYAKERKTKLMEDIVKDMRDGVNVSMVKGDAFRVSYVSNDARTAMKVTERLASLFVEENLRDREVLAEGANQFLDSQLDEARRRLLEHEKKLEEYRREHAGELPSQMPGNLQALQNMQGQVAQFAESINRDKDRHLVLERLLADINAESAQGAAAAAGGAPTLGGDQGETTAPAGSAAAQLAEARSQLQAMLLRLKPEHPDVSRAKRVIAELERKAEAEALQAPVSQAASPRPVSPLEAMRANRIRDVKAEMDQLERQMKHKDDQQKQLQGAIGEYQRRVEASPTRESEMIALTRDYTTLQGIYTSLLGKAEEAKVSANLERRQIGEQFKVIDAARLPERPFSPDRQLLNAGGIAAGLFLGIALVGLIEFRDSSFRTEDDVVAVLALPVLANVPAIITQSERKILRRRKRLIAIVTVFFMACGGMAVFVWRAGYLDRWL